MRVTRGAKALLRRKLDGKYLLLTASLWPENSRRSQQPDLPGGVVEDGETIEDGLLREIHEETGLTLPREALTLGYSYTYFDETKQASRNFFLYLADISGHETIMLSWEHESYEWLSKEEIITLDIRQPFRSIFTYLEKAGLLE